MALSTPLQSGNSTFKAWLTVGLLCVVGCLNYLDRVILTTMHDSVVNSIKMTDAQFALLTSVFLWIYGILSPFAGFLADKFSRSKVIIISLLVWSILTWLTGRCTNYPTLLAVRALMGISEACYIPAAVALIADYHRGSTRSLANGVHMAGIMTGQSLGFLGGMIADKHSWNSAFMVFGEIGIVYAVILFFLLRDPARVAPVEPVVEKKKDLNFFSALGGLLSTRPFVFLLIFWGLLGMVGWMIVGWLPTYYKEHFSLTQTESGKYATVYMYPFSMLGVILGGAIADMWGKKNKNARILVPIIGMLIAIPAVYIASGSNVLWVAVGGFIIYAFTRVFSDANLMPILCTFADERYRATGYGLLNMLACVVGGLGILATGALRDQHVNMSLLFKIAAGCMVLCTLLLYLVKKSVARRVDACAPNNAIAENI